MQVLTKQELHNLAMNIVGKKLEKMGYEFQAINSKLKKHPQFVLFKKGESPIFVLVKHCCLEETANDTCQACSYVDFATQAPQCTAHWLFYMGCRLFRWDAPASAGQQHTRPLRRPVVTRTCP